MLLKPFVYVQSILANGSLRREEGQTMAEYGVVLGVITVAIIASLILLRDEINRVLEAVVSTLKKA